MLFNQKTPGVFREFFISVHSQIKPVNTHPLGEPEQSLYFSRGILDFTL